MRGCAGVKVRRGGIISRVILIMPCRSAETQREVLPGWAWILPWVLKAGKREKPMGDWSLNTRNKQAIAHPHRSRQETTQLFPYTWHSTFSWAALIDWNNSYNSKEPRSESWFITEWVVERKKKLESHISILLVAHISTCRWDFLPLTRTSRGISFLQVCSLCASLPLPI